MSARAGARRAIDGVLLLDKPQGMTSQRAVSRVKALTRADKVGHTGTLDPMATGLLPLTFGEATKFSHALLDADKGYVALVQLGVTTSTGDAEGKILRRETVSVDKAQIEETLAAFVGEREQTPPMYSALKHGGKPLYEYARRGVEVARAPRRIRILSLSLMAHDGDRVTIVVDCSKGTYVRVLAEEIGAALGCGASLAGLKRTRVGRFGLASATALARFEELPDMERLACLMPVDALVQEFARVDLDAADAERLKRGQRLPFAADGSAFARVYGPDDVFIGVAKTGPEGNLVPVRLISTNVRNP